MEVPDFAPTREYPGDGRAEAALHLTKVFFYFHSTPEVDSVGLLDSALDADPALAVAVARRMSLEPDPLQRKWATSIMARAYLEDANESTAIWRSLLKDRDPLVRTMADDALDFARQFQGLSEADVLLIREMDS